MRNARLRTALVLLWTASLAFPIAAQGTKIGFEEKFALAPDRAKALEQLIPGTEAYYYYRCLERQQSGAHAEVQALLRTWVQRHGRGSRVVEIENRHALLTYADSPAATFEFLRKRLGLQFDHQRHVPGRKPDLPTSLDPARLSVEVLTKRALQKHPNSLDGFRNSALRSLIGSDLNERLLAALLKRLARPDLPNLPALIVRELDSRRSRGFGSLKIHKNLLLSQLEECARLRPELLGKKTFIEAYLKRLQPNHDLQWRKDREVREAYLDRLEAFVQRLSPAQNSLKAHVLHHRLAHDLALGRFDKRRFMAYLRLPRRTRYANPEYIRNRRRGDDLVDSRRSYATGFGSVRNDEALVRAYFQHFFVEEGSVTSYAEYVKGEYLTRLFAETKILAGLGDMERWYSLLDDPAYYERLKERVEISFAPNRRNYFGADEAVSLEVDLKNVGTLLVKVYEINTLNYYIAEGKQVDATIRVEGLVAREEMTHTYDESPFLRVRRKFEFPALARPGVYVVDFIGNGLSSRAVIRKGRLQYQERPSSAGQVFRILDETGKHLDGTSIRLGGREYVADEHGEVLIPYSTRPGDKSIILRHGDLTTLERFRHQKEDYALKAAFYIDRESLLAHRQAKIVLRPALLLNQRPVDLKLLEEPVLSVVSTDTHGVSSSLEIRDLDLRSDQDSVHEIQVPPGLSSVRVSLRGRIRSLSLNKNVDVSCGQVTFPVNYIEQTAETSSPLLTRTPDGYVLDVLGKNGEAIPDRAVKIGLQHRDFTDRLDLNLKTNESGRIMLGSLAGITHVTASGLPDGYRAWSMETARRSYPARVQGPAGVTLRVPYQGQAKRTTRAAVSLIELRGGVFMRDCMDHVAITKGFVELRELTPGDYDLYLEEARQHVEVKITAGKVMKGWAVGRDRMLRLGGLRLLHITDMRVSGQDLLVQCRNTTAETRVHAFSTRYVAPFNPFEHMRSPAGLLPDAMAAQHLVSSYSSGRKVDDEYRYILERRYAKKFPGNMLRRPGILLNPWALEETESSIGVGGGAGTAHGGRRGGRRNLRARGGGGKRRSGLAPGLFPNLDFLPEPSKVLCNLKPDANGIVRIPLSALGQGHVVHALAVGGDQTVYSTLALREQALQPDDRRLAKALDSGEHFAEQKSIEFLKAGATSVVEDASTSRIESYDSLAAVYQLYQTLGGGKDLAEFAFILGWPELKVAEKQELYSSHACHELNFFLHEKDPAFFKDVVRPYLANKAHKTFLDRWLLAEDLSGYLEPWAFAQLNVVERILLTRRLGDRSSSGARYVRELWELQPVQTEELARLFASTISGDALKPGGSPVWLSGA